MPNAKTAAIARKYAAALINLFLDILTQNDYENLLKAMHFLEVQNRALFFLQLPILEESVKEKGIRKLVERFSLPESIIKLLLLLLKHNRASLIPDVLWYITELYKQRRKILAFTIHSSHELHEKQIAAIKQFLARHTGSDIIYTYKEDKNLIAGIRLQSTTWLWEYSIRKHLHSIALSS